MSSMIISIVIVTTITVRFACMAGYVRAVHVGTARPNLVTWTIWSVTPVVAAVAQLVSGPDAGVWLTLSYAVGPLAIVVTGVRRHGFTGHVTPLNLVCAAGALAAIVAWQVTDDPLWAIGLSIATDAAAALPTLVKAHRHPDTEPATVYLVSGLASALALVVVADWRIGAAAYPAFAMTIDLTVFVLAGGRAGVARRCGRSDRAVDARAPIRPCGRRACVDPDELARSGTARS